MLHTHLYLRIQILEFTITLLTQWFINPLNNIEVRLPVFLGALSLTSHHLIGIEVSFLKEYLLLRLLFCIATLLMIYKVLIIFLYLLYIIFLINTSNLNFLVTFQLFTGLVLLKKQFETDI